MRVWPQCQLSVVVPRKSRFWASEPDVKSIGVMPPTGPTTLLFPVSPYHTDHHLSLELYHQLQGNRNNGLSDSKGSSSIKKWPDVLFPTEVELTPCRLFLPLSVPS